MAFRVLILGAVPDDFRRDLERLDDEVVLVAPLDPRRVDAAGVVSLRPHLVVLGEGAPLPASALREGGAGHPADDALPSLSLGGDPQADLVVPAAGPARDAALRLAGRLGRMRRALIERRTLPGDAGAPVPEAGAQGLRERLAQEFSRALRYRHPVAVVTHTLDARERLVGTYGAEAVEEFHALLAATLRRCLRDVDLLYRASAEELVAILPETTAAGARIPADRFLTQTARLIFKPTAASARPLLPIKATSSIGVADGPREGISSADDLLFRARASMGSARAAGGARVFIHGAPVEHEASGVA